MKLYKHRGLFIDLSKIHGYGVFTDVIIAAGELVEECPVSIHKIPSEFFDHFIANNTAEPVESSFSMFFPYLHPESKDEYWHATGYANHLNDAEESNIKWVLRKDTQREPDCSNCPDLITGPIEIASFIATRTIYPGEELVISYLDYQDWDTYKNRILNK